MPWNFYNELKDVVSSLAPESYAEDAVSQLRNEHSYHPDYKLGLHDLFQFPEKYGTNLTSQPGNYLPNTLRKQDVQLDKDLGYNVGGWFSILKGIHLNPRSMFDKSATLVHEARHARDAFDPSGDYYDNSRLSVEDNKAKIQDNEATFKSIRDKLLAYKKDNFGYRANRILSGQPEWDEVKAQLVSYESMLPAGMKLEQSPLGKAILQSPKEKLWYYTHTQPSMSDQSYLEELIKRSSK